MTTLSGPEARKALADAVNRLRASTNGDDAAFEEGNPFDDLTLLLTDYDRLRASSMGRRDREAIALADDLANECAAMAFPFGHAEHTPIDDLLSRCRAFFLSLPAPVDDRDDKVREALKIIARGRADNGRALAGEIARQKARDALFAAGIDWSAAALQSQSVEGK